MPFFAAYADLNGAKVGASEFQLTPGPAVVQYPQEPTGSRIETSGGGLVVQQLAQDNRVRSWIWKGWPAWHPTYDVIWAQVEPLRSRYRYLAGDATPYVYLKEDVTTLLRTISVSGTTITPSYDWLRCRVVEVSRRMREEGSSLVVFEEIKLAFTIEDPSYNDLG